MLCISHFVTHGRVNDNSRQPSAVHPARSGGSVKISKRNAKILKDTLALTNDNFEKERESSFIGTLFV